MRAATSCKIWSEGPMICNVDPKVMPHFSFHAKCNYCLETVPFTTDLEVEMRKHYNLKHRLYCNACKKGDFSTREQLESHLSLFHKNGVCFNCHASFKLASAVAMHVEGPKNDCAVPYTALVDALRCICQLQETHDMTEINTSVYSPISCCSNVENTILNLKEFRKTLLLAHEKAFNDIHQGDHGVNPQQPKLACNVAVSPKKPVTDSQAGCDSSQDKRMVSENKETEDIISQEMMAASLNFPTKDRLLWTCSTCVDAKYTTLSKLLQHVEQKVRNSWWMSLRH